MIRNATGLPALTREELSCLECGWYTTSNATGYITHMQVTQFELRTKVRENLIITKKAPTMYYGIFLVESGFV